MSWPDSVTTRRNCEPCGKGGGARKCMAGRGELARQCDDAAELQALLEGRRGVLAVRAWRGLGAQG
eukprot:214997-Chlamydomonas_euryale.AAC.3